MNRINKKVIIILFGLFSSIYAMATGVKTEVYDPLQPIKIKIEKPPETFMVRLPTNEGIKAVTIGDSTLLNKRINPNNGLSNVIEFVPLKDTGNTNVRLISQSGKIFVISIEVANVGDTTSLLYIETTNNSEEFYYASSGFGSTNPAIASKKIDYLRSIGQKNIKDVKFPFDRYSGNREVLPITVFEDNNLTYFVFSEKDNLDDIKTLPVVYKVVDGYDMPVPQSVRGGVLIVETRSDRYTLRAGNMYACIAKGASGYSPPNNQMIYGQNN